MKAISLWNPWATLVATGAKRNETRSWPTRHRGLLLIHATKNKDHDSIALCFEEPFLTALMEAGIEKPGDMPFGAIIAVCTLADCVRVETISDRVSETERAFGDYSDGRFAWLLKDVQAIEPIEYRGMQGLFEVPDEVLRDAAGCAAWTAHPRYRELF